MQHEEEHVEAMQIESSRRRGRHKGMVETAWRSNYFEKARFCLADDRSCYSDLDSTSHVEEMHASIWYVRNNSYYCNDCNDFCFLFSKWNEISLLDD